MIFISCFSHQMSTFTVYRTWIFFSLNWQLRIRDVWNNLEVIFLPLWSFKAVTVWCYFSSSSRKLSKAQTFTSLSNPLDAFTVNRTHSILRPDIQSPRWVKMILTNKPNCSVGYVGQLFYTALNFNEILLNVCAYF